MSVMQITRKAEYALRTMISLSGTSDVPTSAHDIARRQRVPKYFLDKILHQLVAKELVISRRGPRGGYSLARPAHTISFKDIIEAVEGPIHLNVCIAKNLLCELQPTCAMVRVWEEGQRKVLDVFSHTTLADLRNRPGEKLAAG